MDETLSPRRNKRCSCYYRCDNYWRDYYRGSRDGAVVRTRAGKGENTQASHQLGPGSILGLGVICGISLLSVLAFAPRGFSPGTLVFPPPQKLAFLNSNSSGAHNPERTTPILSLCHGVFTDQSIFRQVYNYYFLRKFTFRFAWVLIPPKIVAINRSFSFYKTCDWLARLLWES